MSEGVNTALFSIASICALACVLFAKSIYQNSRSDFLRDIRVLARALSAEGIANPSSERVAKQESRAARDYDILAESSMQVQNDETILSVIYQAKHLSLWTRIIAAVFGWILSFLILVVRQTKIAGFAGLPPLVIDVCDFVSVAITVFLFLFAVSTFLHPKNTHYGFS